MFIHIWAEVPKYRARRMAVSAEMERLPLTMAAKRLEGIRKAWATVLAESLISSSTTLIARPG